jgi:hypothetical protein
MEWKIYEEIKSLCKFNFTDPFIEQQMCNNIFYGNITNACDIKQIGKVRMFVRKIFSNQFMEVEFIEV